MANIIKPKRSTTAGKVPTTSDLASGELGVNMTDKKTYINNGSAVVQVGAGNLAGLGDVNLTSPSNAQTLVYDSATSKWVNGTGGGAGDVTGPSSATDNAVARFDSTTGKLIQNSLVTVDDSGNVSGILSEKFNLVTAPPTIVAGLEAWDSGNGTLEVGLTGDNLSYKYGQQEFARVYNGSGAAMTKGQVVYIVGAQGNRIDVRLAMANAESTSAGTIGFVAEPIANGAEGWVQVSGSLYKLDTSALTAGAPLYLSPTTAGAYTTTKPAAPNQTVILGWVQRVSATVGSFYVKVDNGYELDELHDVSITSAASGNTLIYDAASSVWKNANITAGTGVTVTNGAGSITIAATNTGTVTSVGASVPSFLSVSGSPITTSGTLAITYSGTALPVANGGTGGTTAALARTGIGATTVGANFFTLTNPSAVTFPRMNADNTVSSLNAADFRTAIGAGTSSTTGTVTSVAVSGGTTGLTTSGGPITTSGTVTLAGTLAVANGGTGGTTAATARTGIGATTVGANFFTLTNPSAVTFPRMNADNTVSSLNAADFRTAIGAGTGSGTVTGVTATSPVASSGGTAPTISLSAAYGDTLNPYASKTAKFVLAAPNAANGVPSFRALVASDIPTLNQNTTGTAANVTGIVAVANGGTGTATPSLIAGCNITISGSFPNQTITASGGGSVICAGPTSAGIVYGYTSSGCNAATGLGYNSNASSGGVAVGKCAASGGGQQYAAVAVGMRAGTGGCAFQQAQYSVALGACTRISTCHSNSIAIGVNTQTSGSNQTHIGPIRSSSCVCSSLYPLYYNTSTRELVSTGGSLPATPTALGAVYGQTNSTSCNPNTSLGYGAGQNGANGNTVNIGYSAGYSNAGNSSVSIGKYAGENNAKGNSVNIGANANRYNCSGLGAVSVGSCSTAGCGSVALGYYASAPNYCSIAIGKFVNASSPQQTHIPMRQAPSVCSNYKSVYYCSFSKEILTVSGGGVGPATPTTEGIVYGKTGTCGTVALGYQAYACSSSGSNSISLGYESGKFYKNMNAISIGYQSGRCNQNTDAIAIGASSGYNNQQMGAIAIGYNAGNSQQMCYSIAIGYQAASNNQSCNAIAIGKCAGGGQQKQYSIAIGASAGASCGVCMSQKSIAIGYNAKVKSCGFGLGASVAIGACSITRDFQSVAIGYGANTGMGSSSSTAIGTYTYTSNSFQTHIGPIREYQGPKQLYYCQYSREITFF